MCARKEESSLDFVMQTSQSQEEKTDKKRMMSSFALQKKEKERETTSKININNFHGNQTLEHLVIENLYMRARNKTTDKNEKIHF